jgi:hypothetical protein
MMSRQATVDGEYIHDMDFDEVPVDEMPNLLDIEEPPV